MFTEILNIFSKKEESTKNDLTPRGIKKVTYPFEGYEKLTLAEKYKVFGENCLKNKMYLKN